jgi:hypothetical protein
MRRGLALYAQALVTVWPPKNPHRCCRHTGGLPHPPQQTDEPQPELRSLPKNQRQRLSPCPQGRCRRPCHLGPKPSTRRRRRRREYIGLEGVVCMWFPRRGYRSPRHPGLGVLLPPTTKTTNNAMCWVCLQRDSDRHQVVNQNSASQKQHHPSRCHQKCRTQAQPTKLLSPVRPLVEILARLSKAKLSQHATMLAGGGCNFGSESGRRRRLGP